MSPFAIRHIHRRGSRPWPGHDEIAPADGKARAPERLVRRERRDVDASPWLGLFITLALRAIGLFNAGTVALPKNNAMHR
jgi:hypothetical protein